MKKVERALISVSDKTGIVEFAQALMEMGVEILSTGGTAKVLKNAGVSIISVDEFTGFPEILEGRVKTLHPKIHGGLLGKRNNPGHQKQMDENKIKPIDLLVVNLYPFEKVYCTEGSTHEEIIENIDIGGPTMLRSAAKNYQDVAVVVKASRYQQVLEAMKEHGGVINLALKQELAGEVFEVTAAYDALIAEYFSSISSNKKFKDNLTLTFEKVQDLRYGENPHQSAAFYKEKKMIARSVSKAVQLHGKELSFNNIIDLEGALDAIVAFVEPACAIIKHTNPCGAAIGNNLLEAYEKALSCDPISAFGSIVGFNRVLDKQTAEKIAQTFVEAVIAPDFTADALEILEKKKNIRLLKLEELASCVDRGNMFDLKKVAGGLLIQKKDTAILDVTQVKVATKRMPTDKEMEDLIFAWEIVKSVKSNAIVFVKDKMTVGIGAGQMSRVDSSEIAVSKARKIGNDLTGSVLASDAFFPFRDGIEAAYKAGATAIIQPGGSMRDDEVIAACDEYNMAMVFTGMRHFKH